jgi:protein-arginine deiminase
MSASKSPVHLDVDADRDGQVEEAEEERWTWKWGAGQPGAIVVCDPSGSLRPELAASVRLRVATDITDLVDAPAILLSLNSFAAGRVTLWYDGPDGPVPVVGALAPAANLEHGTIRAVPELDLRLTAHTFPDGGFDGLVEIVARLDTTARGKDLSAIADRVLLRVAPWVMPDSTRAAERVYVVHNRGENSQFVDDLEKACAAAGVELREVAGEFAGGDPWIQDEVEPGYTQAPGIIPRPVIVDGPRNRGLDPAVETVFAADEVDVYSVPAHGGWATSLDSFGNLEVSPPISVGAMDYRLGRIVIGTTAAYSSGRKAALAVRQFLNAQGVQSPVEIFTDWLLVGHVDEIVCFEPDPTPPGFRIQIASPGAFRDLLERWEADGHGEAVLWEGRTRFDAGDNPYPAERTVRSLLEDEELWAYQDECTNNITTASGELAAGLGIESDAFVPVPVAFEELPGGAAALFPDMVNHLIVGDWSIVPDPFGPVVNQTDLLKQAYRDLVPHRKVSFIDDWDTYHLNFGEVHCGTNVIRGPDLSRPWWEVRLPDLWDASIADRV